MRTAGDMHAAGRVASTFPTTFKCQKAGLTLPNKTTMVQDKHEEVTPVQNYNVILLKYNDSEAVSIWHL